jgi:hypothetical protein
MTGSFPCQPDIGSTYSVENMTKKISCDILISAPFPLGFSLMGAERATPDRCARSSSSVGGRPGCRRGGSFNVPFPLAWATATRSINRAVLLRICGCQSSHHLQDFPPRRGVCLVTGLGQFGAPQRGHLNRIVPVSQKENAGRLRRRVEFGRV